MRLKALRFLFIGTSIIIGLLLFHGYYTDFVTNQQAGRYSVLSSDPNKPNIYYVFDTATGDIIKRTR